MLPSLIPAEALQAQAELEATLRAYLEGPTPALEHRADALRTQRDEALRAWFFAGLRVGLFEAMAPSIAAPDPAPAAPEPESPFIADELDEPDEPEAADDDADDDWDDESLDPDVFDDHYDCAAPGLPTETVDHPPPIMDLAALAAAMRDPTWQSGSKAEPLHPLFDELTRLGPPPLLGHEMDPRPRAEALDPIISDPSLFAVPGEQLLVLLTWLAAEVRAIQAAAPDPELNHERRVKRLVKAARATQCGFVYGLALDHTPKAEHWTLDADAAWTTLHADLRLEDPDTNPAVALVRVEAAADAPPEVFRLAVALALKHGVSPHEPGLRAITDLRVDDLPGKVFRRLRKAVPVAAEPVESAPRGPVDHPYRTELAEMRAVIIGGEVREPARERLQRDLGLAELEWQADDGPRGLERLLSRIENGTVKLVFPLIRFCSHSTTDAVRETCKRVGALHAPVTDGYGTTQVLVALDRAFTPRGDASVEINPPS